MFRRRFESPTACLSKVLGALALLTACQGAIGDAPTPTLETLPMPGANPDLPSESDLEAVAAPRVWRLSNQQYQRALDDLLGAAPSRTMLQEVSGHGFANTAGQNPIESSRAIEYQDIAQRRVADALNRAETRANLWPCDEGFEAGFAERACIESFIVQWGRRTFRRELLTEELSAYVAFFEETRDALDGEAAVQLVLETMLQSPSFLYRTELGPLDAPAPNPGELIELTAAEQVNLLAFALWGRAPDPDLLAALDETDGDLESVLITMMDDARLTTGFTDFVEGLMDLEALESASPAVGYEDRWDELRQSMRAEPHAFVEHLFFAGEVPSDFAQLWTADYSFADERLAPLYGGAVEGGNFERIAGTNRPGLLGQLAFLAGHSLPNGTSPPRRGKLIAERIFCQTIPEPPANIDVDEEVQAAAATTRAFFETATGEGTCGGSCHAFLNPTGFALENFDAVGAWRDTENGVPIDAAVDLGSLGLGQVDGPIELGRAIAESDRARACLARQYFRFALGRIETPENTELLEALEAQFVASEGELRRLLANTLGERAMHTRRMIE
ncbi:MAG: DUF1588 domain-containing protein [Myxococcota bacterium]